MTIAEHFQQQKIEENEVFLSDEEEQELSEYLGYLIVSQSEYVADAAYSPEDAKNLAGLAFVAGRSYQHEKPVPEIPWGDIPGEETPGYVNIRLTSGAAARLIERLLGED